MTFYYGDFILVHTVVAVCMDFGVIFPVSIVNQVLSCEKVFV